MSIRPWINKSLAVFDSLVPEDGSGGGAGGARELTADNLADAFSRLGLDPPQDMDAFLRSADTNNNNRIDSNEFLKLVGKLLDPASGKMMQAESGLRKWASMLQGHQLLESGGGGGGDEVPSDEDLVNSIAAADDGGDEPPLDLKTRSGVIQFTCRCLKRGHPRLLYRLMTDAMKKEFSRPAELTSWLSFAATSSRKSATRSIVSVTAEPMKGEEEDDEGARAIVVVEKSPFATTTHKISMWFAPDDDECKIISGMMYDGSDDGEEGYKTVEQANDFADKNEYDYFVCVARGTVDHQHFAWHIDVPASVKLAAVGAVKPHFAHQELRKFAIKITPESRVVRQSDTLSNVNADKCDPGATTVAATTFSGPCHIAVEYDAACMQRYVACLLKSASDEERDAFKRRHTILPLCDVAPRPAECIEPHKTASTPEFKKWLADGGIDRYDPDKESVVSFCVRIIRHLSKSITYDCTEETLNKRSSLASIIKWTKTDCGGHTQLFTNACAVNGIQCREALSYTHVYPEVFVPAVSSDGGSGGGAGFWFPCDAVVKDVSTILDEEQTVILQSQGNFAAADISGLVPEKRSRASSSRKKVVDVSEIPRLAEEFVKKWYGEGADAVAPMMHPHSFKSLKPFLKECIADAGPVTEVRRESKVVDNDSQLVLVYTHNQKMQDCVATVYFDVRSDGKKIIGVGAWMGCEECPPPPGGYEIPQPLPPAEDEDGSDKNNNKYIFDVGGQSPAIMVMEMRKANDGDEDPPEWVYWGDGAWLFEDFVRAPGPGKIDLSPSEKFLLDYGFNFDHLGKMPRDVPTAESFGAPETMPPMPEDDGDAGAAAARSNNNNKRNQIITDERRAQLRRAFDAADEDESGELSKTEAMSAFIRFFPDESPAELRDRIMKADVNGDGNLSFEEFVAVAHDAFSIDDDDGEEQYDDDY